MSDPRRALLTFDSLEDRTVPTVITVTGTGDGVARDRVVTLREAILAADSHKAVGDVPAPAAGTVTIKFNIPGNGQHVIAPRSALPGLTGNITIDGTSQHGYAGKPLIVLDGYSAGASSNGLILSGGHNTVRGLSIERFRLNGIVVASNFNVVAADWIGVDGTGYRAAGNGADGIVVVGANNTIGGAKPADRVVISGNKLAGIDLTGTTTSGNLIEGTYIGTDATGFASVANGTGVLVQNGARSNVIGGGTAATRNVITGNRVDQVRITGRGTAYNVLQGNYIGVDATGESAAQQGGDGVLITGGATNNRIGGTTLGQGNLIGGIGLWTYGKPAGAAVEISATGTTGNVVRGNWIGMDARGVAPLTDAGGGLVIRTSGNTIGGTGRAQNVVGDPVVPTGLSSSNHVLPKLWYYDSIRYLGRPDLLGGSFRA